MAFWKLKYILIVILYELEGVNLIKIRHNNNNAGLSISLS